MKIYHPPKKGIPFQLKTGKIYYYNSIDDQSQFDPYNISDTIYLPDHWDIKKSSEGNTYFYNTINDKSQYKIPDDAEINKLEPVREPMIDSYSKHGLSLKDYYSTIQIFKELGVGKINRNIIKITEGCINLPPSNK